jgi:hypothetical protein
VPTTLRAYDTEHFRNWNCDDNSRFIRNSPSIGFSLGRQLLLARRLCEAGCGVLAFGGFLGMGEKLFAVPWSALKLNTTGRRFVLNVEAKRLESAPGFDKDHWPDMADATWAKSIHSYYGTQPDATRPDVPMV